MAKKDPREPRISGWEMGVAMYPLRGVDLPRGVACTVGTNFPKPTAQGKHVFAVRLEMSSAPDAAEARRLLRTVYRAVLAHAGGNQAWAAAVKLGGQDDPRNLPEASPVSALDAYCFWVLRAEFPRPVLALRTNYQMKDRLRGAIQQEWAAADGKANVVRSGWWPEAKLWWVADDHAYPRFLKLLRAQGLRLVWIQRDGFPPAPPIEGGGG